MKELAKSLIRSGLPARRARRRSHDVENPLVHGGALDTWNEKARSTLLPSKEGAKGPEVKQVAAKPPVVVAKPPVVVAAKPPVVVAKPPVVVAKPPVVAEPVAKGPEVKPEVKPVAKPVAKPASSRDSRGAGERGVGGHLLLPREERRVRHASTTLTDAEYEAMDATAMKANVTLSSWIRTTIIAALKKKKK